MSNTTRRTLKLLKTAALMVASGVVGLLRIVAVLVSGTSRQGASSSSWSSSSSSDSGGDG